MKKLISSLRKKTGNNFRAIKSFVFGNYLGGLPSNAVNSIRQYTWDTGFSRNITHFETIHAASEFDFLSNAQFHPPEWMSLKFCLNERFTVGIQDSTVFPASGAVAMPDGRMLVESVGSFYKLMTYSGFRTEALRNRFHIHTLDVKVIVPGIGGFYHWFMECLPGLIRCLNLFPSYKILIPTRRPRFIDQSLQLILGTEWKNKVIFSDYPLKVPEAVFYNKSNGGQYVHPLDAELVRERFLSRNVHKPSTGKIYVSRSKAAARSVDEQGLIAQFTTLGYKPVELETLPLREQINIMESAEAIAGMHGAGLTHGVFSKPNCRILEIFRSDVINDCYARLLCGLQRKYFFSIIQYPNMRQDRSQILLPEETVNRFLS